MLKYYLTILTFFSIATLFAFYFYSSLNFSYEYYTTCLTSIKHQQIHNINKIKNKNKLLKVCQNEVEYENDLSVWSMLSEDHFKYAVGALKLIKSIQINVNTTKFDAILIELTEKPLQDEKLREHLTNVGWKLCQMNRIAPRDEDETFGRFRDQFTKLNVWRSTEYRAIYYFDADTLALRNLDHYFRMHSKLDSKK